jgi:hypothetical protein
MKSLVLMLADDRSEFIEVSNIGRKFSTSLELKVSLRRDFAPRPRLLEGVRIKERIVISSPCAKRFESRPYELATDAAVMAMHGVRP